MKLSSVTPKAEPVAWTVVAAAGIAAAMSYGLNITNEMKDFLILVSPFVIGGIVARFSVYAPDTVEAIADQQYQAGVPPTEPQPDIPPPAAP